MADKIDRGVLQQHWIHSHEEDTPTEMVFRPADFPFPPSRGRHGFELKPDGSYAETAIGPADKPQKAEGSWDLQGDRIVIHKAGTRAPTRTMEVTTATPNRLVIRK
jgi:hypothetical protein